MTCVRRIHGNCRTSRRVDQLNATVCCLLRNLTHATHTKRELSQRRLHCAILEFAMDTSCDPQKQFVRTRSAMIFGRTTIVNGRRLMRSTRSSLTPSNYEVFDLFDSSCRVELLGTDNRIRRSAMSSDSADAELTSKQISLRGR
jgi:hypothetical protein